MARFPVQWVHSWLLGRMRHSSYVHSLNLQMHLWLCLFGKRITIGGWGEDNSSQVTFTRVACACLRAHPQFHFQLAAPRKAVMKAVAKEHSDVTERLQTQTVNSTLWVACHHHQLPRESRNTWLSQPSAQLPTSTTATALPPTHCHLPLITCHGETCEGLGLL